MAPRPLPLFHSEKARSMVRWPRYWWIVLLVLAGSGSPLRAELRFSAALIDAGSVYTGTPLVRQFHFRNDGSSALEIREIHASCGCLAPRIAQRTCKPGEKGVIELEVNTLSQAEGPHAWTVSLRSWDGEREQEYVLELRARLITEVRVQPAALVWIADREARHELTVTDLRPRPFTIKEARSSMNGMSVDVAPAERDPHGHTLYRVSCELNGHLPNGRHDGFIEIDSDDPRYGTLRVPLTVIKRYRQRLAATPDEVTLIAPAGQPFPSRIVLIRDQEGQKVKIASIAADDPAVRCRWAEGPDSWATLKIHAKRPSRAQEWQTIVRVLLREPVNETLFIPVRCVAH